MRRVGRIQSEMVSIRFPRIGTFEYHDGRSDVGPIPGLEGPFDGPATFFDAENNALSVINWEDAFVGPWELVGFAKELSTALPVMDGPPYRETLAGPGHVRRQDDISGARPGCRTEAEAGI